MKYIHCKVFGHDFYISRHVTNYVKEYTCNNCKKEFTTDSSGNITALTPKFKEINQVLGNIHNRRITKAREKLNSDLNLLAFKH
ncbi:hypothetical protein [Seonamhaeicola maritimus]|uniref:hypothetical protein n=1 Tax=Seonamhaeicola maritimus TaxID=2591822 RepID=UPI002494A206|nr:hypothetical protein [Seonamhaeicola maritimus]